MRARICLATLMTLLIGVSCTRHNVAGKYLSERDRSPKDYLELAADGTFTLQEDGSAFTGTYKLTGTQIALTTRAGKALTGKLEGGVLSDPTGTRWTKQ
jgi:hypothetical protein